MAGLSTQPSPECTRHVHCSANKPDKETFCPYWLNASRRGATGGETHMRLNPKLAFFFSLCSEFLPYAPSSIFDQWQRKLCSHSFGAEVQQHFIYCTVCSILRVFWGKSSLKTQTKYHKSQNWTTWSRFPRWDQSVCTFVCPVSCENSLPCGSRSELTVFYLLM